MLNSRTYGLPMNLRKHQLVVVITKHI